MQRSNLKLERRRKAGAPQLDRSAVPSESLDAWVWAERISVVGLFVLAVGYTLFVVHELFVPVVTAWVMGAILRPIVESAERHGVPRVVAVIATATVALLILLAIVGLLSTPLAYWIGRTAELAQLIKGKLQLLNQPLAIVDEFAHALSGISGEPAPASIVNYDTSTIIRGIVSTLTPVITQFLLFFFAMIFWMLYANEVKGGIALLFSGDRAGQVARRILDDAEKKVSQYFGTLVVVNLCLAALAVGLAGAVGLPNPLLWGVLAGTLSFIPYLGPAIIVATLFVIGLLSLPSLTDALVAPILWIFVTTLEGQIITPMIIGHRLLSILSSSFCRLPSGLGCGAPWVHFSPSRCSFPSLSRINIFLRTWRFAPRRLQQARPSALGH